MSVEVLQESLLLPTEPWDRADPHPDLFSVFRRDWRAFPYPRLLPSGPRVERSYRALVLENEYLRITVLPELGGRLYRAIDKPTGQDLFYFNRVVKPRCLAIRGPWISGGIEYNFPLGHNVWTISPVQFSHGHGEDGSGWIEVGETDRTTGMRWSVRHVLRPGRRAFHTRITLENPTPHAHSYYYWSNAAVADTPSTRLLIPYDEVQFHDAEIAPFRWPYLDGKDLSYTKNIEWVVSLFGRGCHGSAFGYFDEERDFGVCHLADPEEMPGKKVFSWGYGQSRERWQRELTDEDGTYLELQAGRFDTQTDLALFPPGERMQWEEHWLPAPHTGGWTAASPQLLCSWLVDSDPPQLRVFSPITQEVILRVCQGGETIQETTLSLSPQKTRTVYPEIARAQWISQGVSVEIGPLCFSPHQILLDRMERENRQEAISLDEVAQQETSQPGAVPDLDLGADCLLWAERLRARRLPVEAEKFYQRALEVGGSQQARKAYGEFRAALEQVMNLRGLQPPLEGSTDYAGGRWMEAMASWQRLAQSGSAIAAHALALAHLEQHGDRAAAVDCLSMAREADPIELRYLQHLVHLLLSLRRLDDAEAELQRYQQPDHPEVRRLWVALYAEQGRWEDALDIMKSGAFDTRHSELSLSWLWAVVHTQLGMGRESFKERQLHLEEAQKVPAHLGDDVGFLSFGSEARVRLGDLYRAEGRPEAARQAWEATAREPRGALDSLVHWKATALQRLGFSDAALSIWRRMREEAQWRLAMNHPARAYLLYLQSLSHQGLGDSIAAQSLFQQATDAGLTWNTRVHHGQFFPFY
jgi:tetratricopeptide (TPR) repeat protein